MKIGFLGSKKEEEHFLALDIGTEAVKALIFCRQNGKITILGASSQYYDQFGVFNGRDFEKEVFKKAVAKAAEDARGGVRLKILPAVFLGLPADIFKGRVVFQSSKRKNPKEIIDEKEKEEICQGVLKTAEKKISQDFSQISGILPQELEFLSLEILEVKIDGYEVPDLQGYQGENLEFRILATFAPKYYLQNFREILKDLDFGVLEIIHEVQNLIKVFKENNAIFLDIGGEVTQIFLMKDGKLEIIHEFGLGGRVFSQALSRTLGLSEEEARNFKERYVRMQFSEETRKRIKEIFSDAAKEWFGKFKSRLKTHKGLLPSTIFLFGGGSELPEIAEILEEGGWEVKFILPKQLNVDDKTHILNNPKYINAFLLCYAYARKKNF